MRLFQASSFRKIFLRPLSFAQENLSGTQTSYPQTQAFAARRNWRAATLALIFLISLSTFALALNFPALTGRVIDDAHILSPAAIQQLDQNLAAFEQQSTDQIVVATIPSLEGASIEDYGYQLGRFWGIGQKGKNNGAILLVAPHERKVRIEVGYGLEGTLTDAISSQIIQTIILPSFRQGQMESGVVQGANAIISVLGGHPNLPARPYAQAQPGQISGSLLVFLLIFVWLALFILRMLGIPWWLAFLFMGSGGSGSSSGGFSGGFSGGGGSFGGGGASGAW